MRLSTYKRLIDSARKLPEELEGANYFEPLPIPSPRRLLYHAILEQARMDKGLMLSELADLFNYEP